MLKIFRSAIVFIKELSEFMRNFRLIVWIISFFILLIFGTTIFYNRLDKVENELVETKSVLPENEGKLVIVSGTPTLENGGVIVDKEAGLQVKNAIYYYRRPYQNIYVEKSKEVVEKIKDKKTGDYYTKTKVKTSIEREWVLSTEKRDKWISVYENPPAINLSSYYSKNDLKIGEFLFDSLELASSTKYVEAESRGFTKEELDNNCKEYIKKVGMNLKTVNNGKFSSLSNGSKIGDIRIEFYYQVLKKTNPITIVGRQEGNRIVTDNKEGLQQNEHIKEGIVSKDEYLKWLTSEESELKKISTILVVIAIIGILLTLSPKDFKPKPKPPQFNYKK